LNKNGFIERLIDSSKLKSSRVILSLDLDDSPRTLKKKAVQIIDSLGEDIVGVKINYHLLLPLDLNNIKEIIIKAHEKDLQVIADIKLNDISNTNLIASKLLWKAGFDAIIVNPFVGHQDALKWTIEMAHRDRKGVIFLVYMSHAGARDGYGLKVISSGSRTNKMYEIFALRALKWRADGVIVGATKPSIITNVAKILMGKLPIFCPGIGTQGGSIQKARLAGGSFMIVGRSILNAPDPKKIVEIIRVKTWS